MDNVLQMVILFWNLGKQYTRYYADKLLGQAAVGFNWKGAVSYFSDLPTNASPGDAYTVKYSGTSSTTVDGSEYVWGNDGGVNKWVYVRTIGEKGPKGDPGEKGDPGNPGADGKDGENGKNGADGYSPTASVSKAGKETTIRITDKDGTTEATVSDGDTNVIESVKLNGTAIPVAGKSVNIDLSSYAKSEDVPKNVSDLTNDRKYQTESEMQTYVGEQLSTLTYLSKVIITKEQAQAYIADPTLASFNVIYLVKDAKAAGADKYFEYQRLGTAADSVFEMTGDTSTDLSEYAKTADVNTALGKKADKVTGATAGHIATLTADGGIEDSGKTPLTVEVVQTTIKLSS